MSEKFVFLRFFC